MKENSASEPIREPDRLTLGAAGVDRVAIGLRRSAHPPADAIEDPPWDVRPTSDQAPAAIAA